MADHKPVPLSREDVAKIEIGETAISRRTAWGLLMFFLVVIVTIPIVQGVLDRRAGEPGVTAIGSALPEAWAEFKAHPDDSLWDRVFAANAVMLGRIKGYETDLEDDSFVAQAAIPRVQAVTSRFLGLGNEQAYVGRDGWLFYRPGVDYLTGQGFLDQQRLRIRSLSGSEDQAPPQPDPRLAILDFKRQLEARGITLVLMPMPVKAVIQPDRLSASYSADAAPLKNPSYDAFIADLRAAGVNVFDPTTMLQDWRMEQGSDAFLKTDTHWRPNAMQAVAKHLADYLRTEVGLADGSSEFRTIEAPVENHGDIAVMLKLPADQTVLPPESAAVRVVLTPGGELWRPSRTAEVLLLGDSFANIYSLGAMNWGESAGFAEQLSLELKQPLDTFLRNDAGAFASREMLVRELARGNDRLEGKQVVIWEFAARELAVGDWKLLDLKLGESRPATFYAPEDGATPVQVTALVEAVSPIPRPGSVPYKDHVFAAHLSELTGEGVPAGAQAVVYLRSMTDGALTSAARIRTGDRITLNLISWSDVAGRYERFNRSELDDENLQFEPPCWGELSP